VIVRPAIKALAQYVAGPRFSFGSTLESRHGAALLAVAQVDHLVPRSSGGGLDLDNLVTACWACNYGKDGYTLEQLGIEDPRAREPLHTAWDGGSASVAPLKQLCAD
jgi:hypothetical protein